MNFVVEGAVRFPKGHEGDVERFCAEFAEVELPVITESGLGIAGAWTLNTVEGVELLHLYGPISSLAELTASGQKMARLPADHPFLSLYSWITDAEISYSRTVRPLIDPVDRQWWRDRTAVSASDGYVVASCRYGITGERLVRPSLASSLRAVDAEDRLGIAIAYDTLFGEFGTTRVIGTTPSLSRFASALDEHTVDSAPHRDQWVVARATPLPYSPLR